MNIEELRARLAEEKIPPYLYHIQDNAEGGEDGENKYCLSKQKAKWLVYMCMDGKRYGSREHIRESSAVNDLYKRLKAAHNLIDKEEKKQKKKAEREASK